MRHGRQRRGTWLGLVDKGVKGLLQVIEMLKGRPKEIKKTNSGVTITAASGAQVTVNKDIGQLFQNSNTSGAKSRFVHSPGRLLLSAALFSLVLLTLDLSLGSFLLIEQDRFDGRNPRQGVQAL